MLKDTNKFKQNETHFSYDDYKQKVHKNSNKDVTIFVSVFVIGLLMILGFVKILSPNVDVGIATAEDNLQFEDENTYQSFVDERLKRLQSEDARRSSEDETIFTPELDEKVILPKQIRKTVGAMEAEKQRKALENKPAEEMKVTEKTPQQVPTVELPKPKFTQPSAKPDFTQQEHHTEVQQKPVNAKVVVGYYATNQQAEVAKTIIQDAGLGVVPVVKNMNGYYTLQVGAYTSTEKAHQAANNLLNSNFPARVIVE